MRDQRTRRRTAGTPGAEGGPRADDAGGTSETDEGRVDQGGWSDCWICEDVFRRRTQTRRYCAKCSRGFCEGWHGSLDRGYGTCVVCWADARPA